MNIKVAIKVATVAYNAYKVIKKIKEKADKN